MCLVASEQRPIINEIIGTFQKYNAAWTKTNITMTDKDMIERDDLAEAFPDVTLQLCQSLLPSILLSVEEKGRLAVVTERILIQSYSMIVVLQRNLCP